MSANRTRSFLAVIFVLAICPTPASGEAPSQEARQRARQHAREAATHYNVGRFQEALDGYTAAYEIIPAPGLLFNLGQCHRELGNHERVLFFFERFLGERPEAANRAMVEELIAESRAALERQQAEERTRAEVEAEERRRADERERLAAEAEAERRSAEAAAAAAAAAATEPTDGERPFYRTWWFWTIVGTVVAAGAVTAGVVAGTADDEPTVVLPSGSLGTLDER